MNDPIIISKQAKEKVTGFLLEAMVKINSAEMVYIDAGLSREFLTTDESNDLRLAHTKILGVFKSLK